MLDYGIEDEYKEFKESTGELKEGVRSIAAMLNKHNKAVLYFGITNKGKVVGQQVTDETLRDVSQAVDFNIEPAIIPQISVLDGPREDLKVIRVTASGNDTPYSAYGQYLIRSADEDKRVTREALRKMFTGAGFDFIAERKSLRQDLTFEAFVSLLASKGDHIISHSALIKSKGLKNGDGEYNLMSFLLSDQSDVSIKAVRFAGKDKTSMCQRKEFGNQCLMVALKQAMDYVESLNETNVVLGHGGRKDTFLFDKEAFEEAWKNACVHNSWLDMVPPAVYIFDDRVEVVSYGGLPFGLTLEEFFGGTSRPTNKALRSIFASLDLCEQTGHGIPTIAAKYGRNAFKISENYVTVTLPFAFKPTWAIAMKGDEERIRLSAHQKAILRALEDDPRMTGVQLAEKVGIGAVAISRNMTKLKEMGLIERVGSNKLGFWVLKR